IGGMARRLYEHEEDTQHKNYAQRIIKYVERLERMLLRIDEYKTILVSTLSRDDINRVVKGAVIDIKEIIDGTGKDITIESKLMPEPPTIDMDAGNLRIALFNILHNSVEAIEKKGGILIETYPLDARTLALKITDTGAGISQDEIRKIFNPFQTSKFEGAGMGLTISYRIIQDHGAEIEVESEKGSGTTVLIKFHPAQKAAGGV
ncbi:MAG: ATP-binding protein, partial [Deltaproteobacteria bacterium]|nr:ATP-binding protein [Deltaproteobacteria bacterium]